MPDTVEELATAAVKAVSVIMKKELVKDNITWSGGLGGTRKRQSCYGTLHI